MTELQKVYALIDQALYEYNKVDIKHNIFMRSVKSSLIGLKNDLHSLVLEETKKK